LPQQAGTDPVEDAFRPDEEKPSHEALTDREYQVLKMLGAGMRIQAIADQLGLAPNTVSTCRHQVLNKLDLAGNEALYDYGCAAPDYQSQPLSCR
jgi:DNA-binding NarL/FixJ family response regulator